MSKSLGPDLRLAVVAGDAVTIARVEGRQALGTGWVSYLLQETVAELWQDPDVEAAARASGRDVRRPPRAADRRAGGARHTGDRQVRHGGLGPGRRRDRHDSALLDRGWAVAPGERFRIASAPGIRIGIATLTQTGDRQAGRGLVRLPARRPRRTD